MLPVQHIAQGVIAEIIRRQPLSPEKVGFAWSVAVGPALARVTTVELRHHNLIVSPRDPRWARELERARDTILARVQLLLGQDEVKGLHINA
jgi:hypothetical protein